ncbi:SDR family NAD(P)-dependent oxidoreductase [Alicyclobacillus vulcanalis]|nr:SDR family NAD(P)-dependent oxidoreductase [Alicyclobacillus vulcanalis]
MAIDGRGKVAVVTGASSGIGRQTAIALARAGFDVAVGARRKERLAELTDEIARETGRKAHAWALDVTSAESIDAFVQGVVGHFGRVHVLVNNAGKALGRDPVETGDEADWQEMLDTNVMGLMRMTKRLIPHLVASGDGHIVNLGSIAGHESYAGGSVYCATKFAVRAITEALRHELLGKPVRVTSIDPGMVETEFSLVRFHGDSSQASKVYQGVRPLTADDIADCIVFAVTRPAHVNIDQMIVTSIDQAGARVFHRQGATS